MNKSVWKRVQYWRKKYNKTPNGWAVAQIIGTDYNLSNKKSKKTRR